MKSQQLLIVQISLYFITATFLTNQKHNLLWIWRKYAFKISLRMHWTKSNDKITFIEY